MHIYQEPLRDRQWRERNGGSAPLPRPLRHHPRRRAASADSNRSNSNANSERRRLEEEQNAIKLVEMSTDEAFAPTGRAAGEARLRPFDVPTTDTYVRRIVTSLLTHLDHFFLLVAGECLICLSTFVSGDPRQR